jgi:hypothetical protein
MKLHTVIQRFSVLHDRVSVSLQTTELPDAPSLQDLQDLIGQHHPAFLEGLSQPCELISLSMSRRLTLLLSAPKELPVITRLLALMDAESVLVRLHTLQEQQLLRFLQAAAQKLQVSDAELLYRLSTFQGKNQRLIPGKRDIDTLSRPRQAVVRKKLLRLLHREQSETTKVAEE